MHKESICTPYMRTNKLTITESKLLYQLTKGSDPLIYIYINSHITYTDIDVNIRRIRRVYVHQSVDGTGLSVLRNKKSHC
jgi:hypothetical protein